MSDIFSIMQNAYNKAEENEIEEKIYQDTLSFIYESELFYMFMDEAMAEFMEPNRPISEVIVKYVNMFAIYLEDFSPQFSASVYNVLATELLTALADYKEDSQDLD